MNTGAEQHDAGHRLHEDAGRGRMAAGRWSLAISLVILIVVSGLLYLRRLDDAPAQVGWDEVFFGLNAHAIATTWRDIHGNFLPLYFHLSGKAWYQPAIVYLTAIVFKLVPVSEASLRLPTALIGLVDIVLTYFVAAKMFKRRSLAVLAAGLLALTPAHFIHSRIAVDYLYPVPFVLVWLLCLVTFVERPRPWLVAAASMALGVGVYTYLASVVMMPLYLALTVATVAIAAPPPKPRYLAETVAFFLPLVIVVPWLLEHPTAYADQITRYKVYDAARFTPLQGLKEFLNYGSLTERVSLYWGYISPNYLFMTGAVKVSLSTRRVGVFLMANAVFLPVGIYKAVTSRRDRLVWLLVIGFATAPAAALLVDDPFAIDRELTLLPFGVLLATYGVASLMASPRGLVRAAAVCLLASLPIEFGYFYKDYFTDYRVRSAAWFDERNLREGVEDIIARNDGRTAVYLDSELGDIENHWRFYLLKHGRGDLLAKTVFYSPKAVDVGTVPSDSLVLGSSTDPWQQEQVKLGTLGVLKLVQTTDGQASLVLLRRL